MVLKSRVFPNNGLEINRTREMNRKAEGKKEKTISKHILCDTIRHTHTHTEHNKLNVWINAAWAFLFCFHSQRKWKEKEAKEISPRTLKNHTYNCKRNIQTKENDSFKAWIDILSWHIYLSISFVSSFSSRRFILFLCCDSSFDTLINSKYFGKRIVNCGKYNAIWW